MDKIKTKWKAGLILLYAIIILSAVLFLRSYANTDSDRLFLTPTFEDSNGWEIYTMESGTKKDLSVQELFDSGGKTVYLTRTLDKKLEADGFTILELDGAAWQESVFLDGKLLYTVDPKADNRIGHVEFSGDYEGLSGTGEYVRLSLPPGYGGKTLTIAAAANSAMEYPSMPMIRMSGEVIQTQLLVSDASGIAMPAAAYMAAALLLLGLFFYNCYYKRPAFSILLLALAALTQALRVLVNFEFYFSSHFSLGFMPAELLIPLSLGLPLLYMLAQMNRWKKWYAPFLLGPLLLSVVCHILGRIPMFAAISAYTYDALLYIPLLALACFAILEWKDKNAVYRLFTPALFAAIACIAIAALGFVLAGKADSAFVSLFCKPILMNVEALLFYSNILLILSGVISFLLTVRRAAETQSELSVLSARNELIEENLQSIQESSAEIAGVRHDMLRHLHTMLDLSHEGERERMESYLEELTRETEAILPVRVCQHPIVNALVTRALKKAKKERIQLDLHVEVPARLSIADNDLCVLVMNMLDNAIEAVSSLLEGKRRQVELTMHVRGRYLFVETINTFDGALRIDEKSGLCPSSKGSGHGYGMKAMSEVAKKYNSKLQIKQEQDMVLVRTALLMPETNA